MDSKQNEPHGQTVVRKASSKSWLAVIIIAVIVIGVIAGLIPRSRQQSNLRAEILESSIPTVTVVSPAPGQSGCRLPIPAEIKPWVETPIYARANGYLKNRLVDIGDHVEAGQLLAEIDTPELDQELERAKALQVQAEAALELSRVTSSRWAGLSKTRVVSDQENEEKQADFKLKEAATESARAEVRRLEKLKSFTSVLAPFAGTITVRNIDSGDLIVAAGGKELFHLAQTQRLRVFVQVPQAIARSIHPGQNAEMTIPEMPGQVFIAKVVRTAGVIASDSRTLLVELNVDNPRNEIVAGSYAQVRFTEAQMVSALTLPANTVMFRPEGPQVGVVKDGSRVELRTVKLGRDFGRTIEVLTGVDEKDRVIVNPADSLASGAAVSIRETIKKEKAQRR
ncbi:efflux RND transporter periplasmic adaptor subunit [Desulfomonile tiedjei]|uniref:RND family efflux transporter, MFP subunit n=1 Tax=Desulfomonile tiedjei (strain ATCC 49306 / DSM 6799 / DCB-1) TaxID=706587 RepID=I4C5D0_DESTA|nr:efflux RND transporter periplasmic adaptor subunit [Desulfomonile tiedjei]AFM24771.1 RND family efflux transporter, MFP subunit [Desulfomonile tiedjei DSM 6799]